MSAHPTPQPDPTVPVMFALAESKKRKLKALLAAYGRKLADFFREAVDRYLEEEE